MTSKKAPLLKQVRLIVAGGRDFNDATLMRDSIEEFLAELDFNDLEFVLGGAPGADKQAQELAEEEALPHLVIPAAWYDMTSPCVRRQNSHGEYNALAGMKRNIKMAEKGTHLIAFWDGKSKGTKDMIDQAKKRNLVVKIINY
ncbi:SLOG family protein [Pseudorhizobium pelagicum]|uniref:YspA cpYpsA-related SLOG domain-containing protein n=1 Tax=Pseudorhizobium pelagicum TaxID=1509405 RepID=A0A922P272_9HYPH|nr:SLOG family protein [Pseudorhizobium pelagicum]YP_008126020.1 SLOG family protein [Alteromonas phage vB_AmaP_AD45-P1]AGM46987.1 hypothetical protein AD45P3_00245 [Alteromonas phage vB_AmaP_AD45-P3]AGM47104.1 hypothetical protein AD45P4_00245 [Alteromonas phage vB_AmaP_AD45-P4]AGM46867.1 hypothetical protein AD45P1_00245 [Alteromonas phage vB_AmaP_AD45-P1]KEQ05543.1 hypothetical protein GV68_08415 [Pseudorhizobium pelagicum]